MTTPTKPHKTTCARSIRQREEAIGRTPRQIAALIHEHCGVTKLRAHRLARGKTLAQAGMELRQLTHQHDPQGPQVEGDQLGSWETGGRTPGWPPLTCCVSTTSAPPSIWGWVPWVPPSASPPYWSQAGRQPSASRIGLL